MYALDYLPETVVLKEETIENIEMKPYMFAKLIV